MPEPQRRFTVVDGATGAKQDIYVDTGVVDEHGHQVVRRGSSADRGSDDGGGGAVKLTLPDLRWNVAILNALATLFTFALVGMFFWMVDRIDDRFEAEDNKIVAISDKVSDLRVDIAGQRADVKAILEKLDDNTQGSPRPRQTQEVHQGKRN